MSDCAQIIHGLHCSGEAYLELASRNRRAFKDDLIEAREFVAKNGASAIAEALRFMMVDTLAPRTRSQLEACLAKIAVGSCPHYTSQPSETTRIEATNFDVVISQSNGLHDGINHLTDFVRTGNGVINCAYRPQGFERLFPQYEESAAQSHGYVSEKIFLGEE